MKQKKIIDISESFPLPISKVKNRDVALLIAVFGNKNIETMPPITL
ncbi:hypothetical protein NXV26_07850 [Bacteroides fragilis]|nr:hypothetical protein [Bacteroides fragilis]